MQKLCKRELEKKLSNAPRIEVNDTEGWNRIIKVNSKDPYSRAIVSFAERWARLMQMEINNGAQLEDVAQQASHEADVEGITVFMYGCAVSILVKYWTHGEKLRQWHYLQAQLHNEGEEANKNGGILDPATIVIK